MGIYRAKPVKKMTPAQIAEAERLAKEWKPDTGSSDATSPLALAIHNQRITVRYARRAGNIGMGGEGEHCH